MTTMTIKEVAEKLGVSTARISQLIIEGKLTPINKRKRGKRFHARFDAVEVNLFMAKRNGEAKTKLVPLPKMPKVKKEKKITEMSIGQKLNAIRLMLENIWNKLG